MARYDSQTLRVGDNYFTPPDIGDERSHPKYTRLFISARDATIQNSVSRQTGTADTFTTVGTAKWGQANLAGYNKFLGNIIETNDSDNQGL